MDDTLKGNIKPVMHCRKLDMLLPYLPTELPTVAPYVWKEQLLRQMEGMVNVNICFGFFVADIHELGAAVIAVTDGNAALARDVANQLGDELWADRARLKRTYDDLDTAIDEVLSSDSEKPFVFADVADNPGAGATCDSTHILRRLLERGVSNAAVAMIYDPETVAQAEAAGVGATIDVKLGSKLYPQITGEPIPCRAYVKAITDGTFVTRDFFPGLRSSSGKSAILVVDGIEVITGSIRTQAWDLEIFRANGITPEHKKLLVVKSTVHYRASFSKIACKLCDIEQPALSPQDPASVAYQHIRRPIYPLDPL